jgi:hypothetical protein
MKQLFWNRIQLFENSDPKKSVLKKSIADKSYYKQKTDTESSNVAKKFNNKKPIWLEIEEADLNDEFVELFAKTVVTKRSSSILRQSHNNTKVDKLLAKQRAHEIEIFIHSKRFGTDTIRDALLYFNSKILDYETLNSIYSIRPQDDEINMIQDYLKTNNEDTLDKPELFLLELSRIPAFEARIHCLVYQHKFNESISSIEFRLKKFQSVCEELIHNEKVKKLLGIILACGNNMNANNEARGEADGFDLAILPNLRDVKSKDNSLTLLQYIAYYFVNKIDNGSIFPLPEPSVLSLIANVNFLEIEKVLKSIEKELKEVCKKAKTVFKTTDLSTHEVFKTNIEKFIKIANEELKAQQMHLNNCQISFQNTVSCFCVKPKSGESEVTPEYFFYLWLQFFQDFKDLWKRELEMLIKQR